MVQLLVGRKVALCSAAVLTALAISAGAVASAGSWTLASPAASPQQRVNFGMAREGSGEVVLFGGFDFPVGNLGDTWIWDGSNWGEASPSASPSARSGPAMA